MLMYAWQYATTGYLLYGATGWIGGKLIRLLESQGETVHRGKARLQNREHVERDQTEPLADVLDVEAQLEQPAARAAEEQRRSRDGQRRGPQECWHFHLRRRRRDGSIPVTNEKNKNSPLKKPQQ